MGGLDLHTVPLARGGKEVRGIMVTCRSLLPNRQEEEGGGGEGEAKAAANIYLELSHGHIAAKEWNRNTTLLGVVESDAGLRGSASDMVGEKIEIKG